MVALSFVASVGVLLTGFIYTIVNIHDVLRTAWQLWLLAIVLSELD